MNLSIQIDIQRLTVVHSIFFFDVPYRDHVTFCISDIYQIQTTIPDSVNKLNHLFKNT